jgi:hypothetical protein
MRGATSNCPTELPIHQCTHAEGTRSREGKGFCIPCIHHAAHSGGMIAGGIAPRRYKTATPPVALIGCKMKKIIATNNVTSRR